MTSAARHGGRAIAATRMRDPHHRDRTSPAIRVGGKLSGASLPSIAARRAPTLIPEIHHANQRP